MVAQSQSYSSQLCIADAALGQVALATEEPKVRYKDAPKWLPPETEPPIARRLFLCELKWPGWEAVAGD
jgi:hypothetical protein